MRSLVLRTLGGLVAAGVGLGVAATPAAAAETSTFRLVAGGVVAQGAYRHAPGTQAAPVRVQGTLAGRRLSGCAVIQVARSGPADGIEWQTFGRHCGPGRSRFRVEASYLFRGVQPPVRLCAGRTPYQAERAAQCEQYRPPAAG